MIECCKSRDMFLTNQSALFQSRVVMYSNLKFYMKFAPDFIALLY